MRGAEDALSGLSGEPKGPTRRAFRAGITEYLRDGGTIEVVQQMAGHESARTPGLYNRGDDRV